jgi:hypothetical protein
MNRRYFVPFRLALAVFALGICCSHNPCNAQRPKKGGNKPPPQDIGAIEGAVWQFTLTPAKGNPAKDTLRGKFRVKNLKIYQGETEDDKEMIKEVGSSDPADVKQPTHTTLTLTEFRAWKRGATKAEVIKGTAKLERESKDANHGQFIDDKGFHWRMRQVRVQD